MAFLTYFQFEFTSSNTFFSAELPPTAPRPPAAPRAGRVRRLWAEKVRATASGDSGPAKNTAGPERPRRSDLLRRAAGRRECGGQRAAAVQAFRPVAGARRTSGPVPLRGCGRA